MQTRANFLVSTRSTPGRNDLCTVAEISSSSTMKVSCGERGYVPRVPWLLVLVLLASQWRPGVGQELEDTGQSCEEEEKSFDSEVRVATLQFEELQIVLLVVAFILLVVIAKLGEYHIPGHRTQCYSIPGEPGQTAGLT